MAGSEGPGRYLRTYDVRIADEHTIAAAVVHEEVRRFCARNQAEGIDAVKHDGKYYCYTSAQRIAKHLRMSLATVERALKKLYAAGLIQKETRWGTKVHSFNPNAMLYFAAKYESCAQAKAPNAYRQNEGTPYRQNEGTERKYYKRSKKQGACKDTSAREATDETRTNPPATITTPQRSADGPVIFAQVIAEALKNTQPQPRRPKLLSDAQIRINEAAQAAQAAEAEKTLPPELRNLATSLLESRDVPQSMRETIEAAIQREFKNPEVLGAWINDLQAMPKLKPETEPAAEAAG